MHHLHGVVTALELHRNGITKDVLPNRPEYEGVGKGTYALPGARRDFWFQSAVALTIAGDDAMLTGEAALYALGVLPRPPGHIEVAVPEGKGSRKERDFEVRRSSHMPEHAVVRHRIRCVPVDYALCDYSYKNPDGAVAHAISRALAGRLTTLAAITATADERGKFPGSARLRRVLADFGGNASHSKRERNLRRALRQLDVPIHPEPYPIRDRTGRIIAQADIAILEVKLDVEVDGPHHLDPDQQAKDRRRDRAVKPEEWSTVRYLIYDIDEDVQAVAREIADMYHAMLAALRRKGA
ncbi:endonuclease domain-containing protein [Euzebya sp.]|uniref:endonuclease domain-containing protein n=1 Tax=Euzebya sp. TaxID=1971409 RepID=UPI003515371C